MHPKALLEAATELVHRVLRFEHPADRVVADFFREHALLGSRERHALGDTVFAVLRELPLLRHLAARAAARSSGGSCCSPGRATPATSARR
jgi:16S rRNA (cytosine967-C5)-methyltransferase